MTLSPTTKTPAPHAEQPRVLLASNSKRLLDVAQELLADGGFEVLTALSGTAALQVLEDKAVHVAIVDSQVRELGLSLIEPPWGTALVRRIYRRWPATKMLYWCSDRGSGLAGLSAGASDLLIKGGPPGIVYATRRILGRLGER